MRDLAPGLSLLAGMEAAAAGLLGGMPRLDAGAVPRDGRSATRGDGQVVAYGERRPVRIDLAPLSAEVPTWRVDDTQALVTVGAAGAQSAALRATQLYRSLMELGAGLAVVQPGEGFSTWEGSPLWLSLAAIRKPAALGVLAVSTPGRVEVMRTEHGEWLVEHAGGPWQAPLTLRYAATAADDEALSLDILYGLVPEKTDTPALHRFDAARSALRFAASVAGPAGWCAQEAWGMVARCCAVAAVMGDGNAPSSPDGATARAMHATLAAVVEGLAPAEAAGPLATPPLSRDRFIAIALSGDPDRIAAGLRGLGRATLDRVRRGHIEGIDALEAVAFAACLGRLRREATRRSPALEMNRVSWSR